MASRCIDFLIRSLLKQEGIPLLKQKHIEDDLETAKAVVKDFLGSDARVLLISGGASVGDFDFGQAALESHGFQVHLSRLNSRPGKPMIFASNGDQLAFVLPGNPLSHFVVYHIFVKTALAALSGRKTMNGASCSQDSSNFSLVGGKAILKDDFIYKRNPRTTFCPAFYFWEEGKMFVNALAWNNSGDLRCLENVNAFLQRDENDGSLEAGEEVEIIIL